MYCKHILSVIDTLEYSHAPEEWHLFVDSSKASLKAVLHNRNKFQSVPLGHADNMKETYENIKIILDKIIYEYLS